MCIKERPFTGYYVHEMTTLDYERGKAPDIREKAWQTDDTIGPWGYSKNAQYKSTNAIIDKLIDIVSKNGNLLLNIPIKADGTLDEESTAMLEEIGEWMDINGEGIYGTGRGIILVRARSIPWRRWPALSQYTEKDIRYTTKGNTLYAFVMGWPGDGKNGAL